MNIRLLRLNIKNFMGTKERIIDFQGKNTNISGENFLGKTTIYDSFCWLLFGKNSEWVTDFSVKPIGMERPEVEVEGVLDVDGQELTLKRTLTEKWTTRRGFSEETFTGNETQCFINDIEKKPTDYKAYIDSIVSEDKFKTLTSAKAFLDKKKPEMRKILMDMSGTVRDEDIAGDDDGLMEIVAAMQEKGYSLDDLQKLTKQNLSAYNGEQSNISPRIDEVRRLIPEEQDWSKLDNGLKQGRDYLKQIDLQLASASAGNQVAKKKQGEYFALQNKIEAYKREQLDKANAIYNETNRQRDSVRSIINSLDSKIGMLEDTLRTYQTEISRKTDALTILRDKYKSAFVKRKTITQDQFVPMLEGACDRCGQSLPEEQLLNINFEAEERFNKDKENALADVNRILAEIESDGKALSATKTEYLSKQEQAQADMQKANDELKIAKATLADTEMKLQGKSLASEIDLTGDRTFDSMMTELETKQSELEKPEDDTSLLLANKEKLTKQMETIRELLEGREEREKAEKRIAELEERGRALSGLIAVEKKRQNMIEKFIRTKAERLEGSINALFEGIRFRLFDTQINGGIVDDCTPLVYSKKTKQWVPYYNGASNSEKIRANMGIVKAFQKAAGIYVPAFTDNAEALTHFIDMPCQVIYLTVTNDKELRIESED